MAEISAQNVNPTAPQKQGIMDQTLGEILNTNPQAQNIIMQTMHLTPEKFQEMVQTAETNPMMNMKISDLLKNGVVQQAIENQGQVSPDQLTQTAAVPQKTSLLDKIKKWFIR